VFFTVAGDIAAPADVPPPITKPAARIKIKIASAARTMKLIGKPCALITSTSLFYYKLIKRIGLKKGFYQHLAVVPSHVSTHVSLTRQLIRSEHFLVPIPAML
jgi:hypothetical protein